MPDAHVDSTLRKCLLPQFKEILGTLSEEHLSKLSRRLTIIGKYHCQRSAIRALAKQAYDKKNEDHEEKLLNVRSITFYEGAFSCGT